MNCSRIDAIINEHALGKLSGAERYEIDAHLEKCQRCADAWLSYETLNSDRPEPARVGLFDEIAARVTAAAPLAPEPASTSRWVSVAGVAASALLIALLAALLLPLGESELESGDSDSLVSGVDAADSPPATPNRSPLLGSPEIEPAVDNLVAGRDYELVRNPELFEEDSEQIVICEFFMFECIFCFNVEPSLMAWEEDLAADVSVERVPALFNPLARLHAQAYYTAELLGASQGLHMAFYEEIHVRGNRLSTVADVREFFVRNGIDLRAFEQAFESGAVAQRMRRAEQLNAAYGVTATPSLGVNGKYLTNPGLTGSNERMFEVVDLLILREAKERCYSGDSDWCPLFE